VSALDSYSDRETTAVLEILPSYIGARYAMLLLYLGYDTLEDLASVGEWHIKSIPGFGPNRMTALRTALGEHGLAFKPVEPVDLMPQIKQAMVEFCTEIIDANNPRGKAVASPGLYPTGKPAIHRKIGRRAAELATLQRR
jgi:hypothetical protein